MKTYGLTREQLAMVSVVQREWAAKDPRAIPGRPALPGRPGDAVTVEDVHCVVVRASRRALRALLSMRKVFDGIRESSSS